jgi:hypothetical protein
MQFHTRMPKPSAFKMFYWRVRRACGLAIDIPHSVTLSHVDLRKTKIRGLSTVDFGGANLAGAIIRGGLHDVYFGGANLEGADLSQIEARNVSFSEANLHNAKLTDAKLLEANLLYADLRGADLSGAHLEKMGWGAFETGGGNFVGCRYDAQTRWPTPMPKLIGAIKVVGESQNAPPAFKFQVEEGGAINKLAVQHRMFTAGEGKAFLVTFLAPPPTLRLAGDSDKYIDVRGQLTCNSPCFLPIPFEIEFRGPSGGQEIRCNACGGGYGLGFGYRRAGDQWNGKIDPTGFFFWFTPHTRGPDNEFVMHGLRVQRLEVKLLSEK